MVEINNELKLIDPKFLQEIQNRFSDATGLAACITDTEGKSIIPESNPTSFCKKIKKSVSGSTKCKKCYQMGGSAAMSSGNGYVCCCHAGLYEAISPIIVNGNLIGMFIVGQVLTEPVSSSYAQEYAPNLGISVDEYMENASQLNCLPESKIKSIANLLNSITELISAKAYNEYISHMNDMSDSISDTTNLVTKLTEAGSLVKNNSNALKQLRGEFSQLEDIATKSVLEVNSTQETIKVIQNVAMNTRILGFNAYIESARAKEYGKSFGVITQEIRDLADKSKESADEIEETMKVISDFTTQMDTHIKNTEQLLKDCTSNIEKFSMIINAVMTQK